jgi:Zn-dependent peptidase ImmA (M78 family)
MVRQANEIMARRIANEVLDDLGVNVYPVDLEAIAMQLRCPVQDASGFPPHCYGALALLEGEFKILVSTACPTPGLRRFTIGHEIGHASIDGHTDALNWGDQAGARVALSEGHYRSMRDPIEVEADHFASELLMPQRWVRPLIDSLPVGMNAIHEVADRFEASLSAAAVRYATVSAAPVVVVLSRGETIEWVAASREVTQADFFRFNAVRTAIVPRGSATRRLAEHPDAVLQCSEASSTGLLCEWFPRAPSVVTVDVDAVGLGSYGRVLTLVMCSEMPDPDELYLMEESEGTEADGGDWRDALRREAGY